MNEKAAGSNRFQLILAIIICARLSCPILSLIPIFTIKFIYAYGALFIISNIITSGKIKKEKIIAFLCLSSYILYIMFAAYINHESIFSTKVFNAYIIFMLFFIFNFMEKSSTKDRKIIIFTTLAGFFVTIIYTMYWLQYEPNLVRMLASKYGLVYLDTPLAYCGGFDCVYGTVIIFTFLISVLLYKSNKSLKEKIGVLAAIILAVVFIIQAAYGTAFLLIFVSLALTIYNKNRFTSIVILLGVLLIYLYRESIGSFMINIVKEMNLPDTLTTRITDIGNIMVSGEIQGASMVGESGRIARIGWSFKTFTEYPLFGITFSSAYNNPGTVGAHCEILDQFALYGLFGGGLLVAFWFLYFKNLFAISQNEWSKKALKVVISVFVILSFLDPSLFTQIVLPLFIIIPFMDSLGDHKLQLKKEIKQV